MVGRQCKFCARNISRAAVTCHADRWRLSTKLRCPECGERKSHNASRCNKCRQGKPLSLTTEKILARLAVIGTARGNYAMIARELGITRANVSDVARRYKVGSA